MQYGQRNRRSDEKRCLIATGAPLSSSTSVASAADQSRRCLLVSYTASFGHFCGLALTRKLRCLRRFALSTTLAFAVNSSPVDSPAAREPPILLHWKATRTLCTAAACDVVTQTRVEGMESPPLDAKAVALCYARPARDRIGRRGDDDRIGV